MRFFLTILLCFILIGGLRVARAADYLNEQEIERVREAQEIDKRTEVFLKIAERRLNALLGTPATQAPPPKEKKDKKKDKDEPSNDYGPEPTGTVSELLENYTKVMSELLDKLDDVYDKKKDNPKLGKAMEKVLETTQSHLKRLDQVRPKLKSEAEEIALEKAMEIAKMAIDGARDFKSH